MATTPPPSLYVARRTRPSWRRVLALALLAVPVFLALWLRWLRQSRRRLDRERLAHALRMQQFFGVQLLLRQLLETQVETPAREALTEQGGALAFATARAVLPDIARQTGSMRALTFDHPATRARLDTYVEDQVRMISATTLTAILLVLRLGLEQGRSGDTLAREVQDTLGLTPGQVRAREAMRERLEAQGLDAQTIQTQLDQATAHALQRRARMIAVTQSITLAHLGQQAAWEEAVRRGDVAAEQVTRHWIALEDARVCRGCASIPGLNPQGVGLLEPFRTPWGPILVPGAHPACRCSLDYRVQHP